MQDRGQELENSKVIRALKVDKKRKVLTLHDFNKLDIRSS